MTRKTPPVTDQVRPPHIATNAFIKARLIDFDTASAGLEAAHKHWLTVQMHHVQRQSAFQVWLVGFASKIGNAGFNKRLSNDRMNAVLRFIGEIDERAMASIHLWEARGEEGYTARESDNSADMRAVEVHIFIGPGPLPSPPPNIAPVPRPATPLPGGPRQAKWAVAAPGGAVANVLPGVVIGFNVFVFRNEATGETRAYIAPQGGFGLSLSLKGLKGSSDILQKVLTSPSATDMQFAPLLSPLPVTWDELEESLATVTSIGGGLGRGVAAIHTTIDAPHVWRHAPSGIPVRKELRLFEFDSVGANFQLGVGGSAVTGPLVKVAD